MVVEGTGRTVEVPKRTSELLTAKGYTVEMAVIATRPILSLISTVQRFYQINARGTIPRATAVEAHDNVVSALPGKVTLSSLRGTTMQAFLFAVTDLSLWKFAPTANTTG